MVELVWLATGVVVRGTLVVPLLKNGNKRFTDGLVGGGRKIAKGNIAASLVIKTIRPFDPTLCGELRLS